MKILKQIEGNSKLEMVGEFKNEHSERFVIYKGKGNENYYITGDEFGWAGGWHLKRSLLPDSFTPLVFATKVKGLDNTFTFSLAEMNAVLNLLPKLG